MYTNLRRFRSVATLSLLFSLLLPPVALAKAQAANGGSQATTGRRHDSSGDEPVERTSESPSAGEAATAPRASASGPERRGAAGQSISSVLNPDGTLNAQAAKGASFNARGYRMQLDKSGAPRFRPAAATANCSDHWDDRFNTPGADKDVLAVADDGHGNIYVGGSFKTIGNIQASGIAKFDGSHWSAFGDQTNSANNGVADIGHSGEVDAIAITPAGVYIGGVFLSVRSTATNAIHAEGIALWDGSSWSALTGDDGNNSAAFQVYALAVSGSSLYVGGTFNSLFTLTGTTLLANSIAKWDGFSWSTLGDGSALHRNGVDGTVHALAVSGGNLYVGGDFRSADTSATNSVPASGIAKWDGTNWSALGDGSDVNNNGVHLVDESQSSATVYAIAISGSAIYVGGNFDLVKAGAGSSLPAANIAKWNGAWSVLGDPSSKGRNGVHFQFVDQGLNSFDVAFVLAITISGNDIYLGGKFKDAVNGDTETDSSGIVKWNGSQWSGLGLGVHRTGELDPVSPLAPTVAAVAVSGTNVFAGGLFTEADNSVTDIVASQDIARWNGTSWSTPAGFRAGTNANPQGVLALVTDTSGNIYIGGDFTMVGNVPANHIAKWNGSEWTALGDASHLENNGTNDQVLAIAVVGTDVYVGGTFTEVRKDSTHAIPASRIAKWDGTDWSALGDGTSGVDNGVISGQGGSVSAIAAAGGYVYVGGTFTEAHNTGGSVVPTAFVARWDGSSWSALGDGSQLSHNGTGGTVSVLTASGNSVYVGGMFAIVRNGLNDYAEAQNIALWDGSHWSALGGPAQNANGVGGPVASIALKGNDVIVGGSFGNAQWAAGDAEHIRVDGIVRWDGTRWYPFGNGDAPLSTPGLFGASALSIAVIGDDIYIAGAFGEITNDGVTVPFVQSSNIAKWNGTDWITLGDPTSDDSNGLNEYVFAMAAYGSNLYIGGRFSQARNSATDIVRADHLATWNGSSWSGGVSSGLGGSSPGAAEGGDGVDGTIYSVAVDANGNFYVGGAFTAVGTVVANNIAKWNGSSWSALGDGSNLSNNGVNGYVAAVATSGNDVYAGGFFNRAASSATAIIFPSNIAKWNGSTWSALGDPSGELENGVDFLHDASNTGNVDAIAISGSNVYVGGSFDQARTSATVKTNASAIAVWNGSSWSALGDASDPNNNGLHGFPSSNGDEAEVDAIAINNTDVFVGGSFLQAVTNATTSTNASNIAKWNGSSWSALGDGSDIHNNGVQGGLVTVVHALAFSGNDLYVGGNFTAAQESSAGSIQTSSIARWDGSHWFALGDGSNVNNNGVHGYFTDIDGNPADFAVVFAIRVNGSDIYLGGDFTQAKISAANSTQANYLAKWDGLGWSGLDGGTNDTVRALAQSGTSLYAGGGFRTAGCHLSSSFGRFAIAAPALAQTWTGATSSDWNSAANWAGGHVPASSENVVIPNSGVASEIDISTADVTVANLTLGSGRTVMISGGRTLTVNGTSNIVGDLAGAGTFNCNGTAIFDGAAPQDIPPGTISNLVINNSGGVSLLNNVTVQVSLTLTNGILNAGAFTLVLAQNATASHTSGYVEGMLQMSFAPAIVFNSPTKATSISSVTYPVGTVNGYSPVDVNVTNVSGQSGSLVINANQGTKSPLNPNFTAQRYWTLTGSNITADLTFHYLAADVRGNEANYKVIKVEGGAATPFPGSTEDAANHQASVTGISSFSDWTVGEPSAPTAAPATISGQVTSADGTPLGGVVMTLTGGSQVRRTISDRAGAYVFTNVDTDGFYTISPERANYLFSPAERSFSLLANKTDAVFAGAPTAESANPLDTPEFFVRQQYLDFLNREPDQAGLDYWSGQVRNCAADARCVNGRRIGVSAAFFIEQEFQQTGSFVYRIYKGSLGRQPNYAEFSADRDRVAGGASLAEKQQAFADEWVTRDAFKEQYPDSLNATEFVNRLFDTAGLQAFDDRQQQIDALLNNGKTRADVLRAVIEITEFKTREYNSAFVLMQYFGYLQRDVDQDGYNFWLNVLNNREPNNYRGMVCSFVTSAEYQRRFSSVATHSNGECSGQ